MVILPPVFSSIFFIAAPCRHRLDTDAFEVLRFVAFLLRRQGHEAVVANVKTMSYDEWASLARSADLPSTQERADRMCVALEAQDYTVRGRNGEVHPIETLERQHFPISLTKTQAVLVIVRHLAAEP